MSWPPSPGTLINAKKVELHRLEVVVDQIACWLPPTLAVIRDLRKDLERLLYLL